MEPVRVPVYEAFQSTLPVRGATPHWEQFKAKVAAFQSTLPVRGATFAGSGSTLVAAKFQSTLPVRGATAKTHKNI